jgi:hypothetical protein
MGSTDKIRFQDGASAAHSSGDPFARGSVVLTSLQSPREKFWGALLSLAPAGVVLRGISLVSFDDFVLQLRSGELTEPLTVFFPMHRVERIELDTALGDVPSLAERFEQMTGKSAAQTLGVEGAR